ncbi:MAG TPA: hypothetical protein VIF62_12915 [Labilithrix sp.]
MSKAVLVSVLVVAVVACSKDSSDLTTDNIGAQYIVTLNDDPTAPSQNTTMEAYLDDATVGGTQDKVDLTGSDALVVTTDKNDNVNLPHESLGHYLATIPNVDRTSFTFQLKRSAGASSSPVTLPDHLALTDSPDGKSIAASGMVHFAWSNQAKGGKLTLHASHHVCSGVTLSNDSVDLPFDDTGTLDVAVSSLGGVAPASGECIDIAIQRAVTSNADAALAYGSSVTSKRTDRYKITVQ